MNDTQKLAALIELIQSLLATADGTGCTVLTDFINSCDNLAGDVTFVDPVAMSLTVVSLDALNQVEDFIVNQCGE